MANFRLGGHDDLPSIFMAWDNRRSLKLLPSEDSFRVLTREEIAEENLHAQRGGMNLS